MSAPTRKNERAGRARPRDARDLSPSRLISEARRSGLDDAEIVELLDFIGPVERTPVADPIFKERLRLDLWWMMQCQRAAGRRRTDRR